MLRAYEESADLPDDRVVQAYSLAETASEKVMALADRARNEPRDLYDLWHLISREGMDLLHLAISNRRSGKLQSRRGWNPPEMWIWRDGAFPALIDVKVFKQAQAVAARRVRTYSNERLCNTFATF